VIKPLLPNKPRGVRRVDDRRVLNDVFWCSDPVPWRNRHWKPCFSKRLYRERNLIERFFSKLKHFRRTPCL
jgi:transposase